MYTIVQYIRHKFPFIWSIIYATNSMIFQLRYKNKLKNIARILSECDTDKISYHLACIDDTPQLVKFFSMQPDSAYLYFKPHNFDTVSVTKLIKNPAFIMIIAKVDSKVVGYAFLRCFANGNAYRGKIVDIDYRGKGIATVFGKQTTAIASALNLHLYGTIAKANIASMASSKSSNDITVVAELPNKYLLVRYMPKQHK